MTNATHNPAMIYHPRGGAHRLFGCRDPIIVMPGPAGTGKSRAALEKVHLALQKHAGARALLVRATRTSLSESALVTFESKVLTPGIVVPQQIKRQFRHSYEYLNGSALIIGGMDNADRIMSTEYDIILVVEATEISEDDAEKLGTRLRNGVMPYQQLIMECNPSGPGHWIKRWIDAGRCTEIVSRHEDNPSLTAEYLERLSRMTGSRRSRLYLGQWAASEGLVYENFDRAIHVIDEMPKGWESWRKVRAIDFGYTNPFVCQWWAIDGDGRAYLYREYVKAGVTVKNHADEIKRLSGDESYEQTIADHDAEDRATLAECGISTVAAMKDVSRGIQAVADRLRMAGDGKPRLYVLRSALVTPAPEGKPYGFLAEVEGYLWQTAKDGKADKEEPVKLNDHSMDTARYAIMAIDKPLVPIFAFPEDEQDNSGGAFDDWSDDV